MCTYGVHICLFGHITHPMTILIVWYIIQNRVIFNTLFRLGVYIYIYVDTYIFISYIPNHEGSVIKIYNGIFKLDYI